MDKSLLILFAVPSGGKIKNFFSSDKNSVMELLRNPKQLRPMGWGLNTLDTPRIVKGEFLEVNNGNRKIIRLYEDGTLIFSGAATANFLGWGANKNKSLTGMRLNPLAVIEVALNFVNFYKDFLNFFEEKPKEIKFLISIKNAFTDAGKLYLNPYGVNTRAWAFNDDKKDAPEADMTREVIIKDIAKVINYPRRVTFELLEKLYLWFGFTSDKIPYACGDGEKRAISDEEIKKIK